MHLRHLGALLGFVVLAFADAAQQALPTGDTGRQRWDDPPHPDATGHLIFDTALNLLNHWSNAYHRNGHTVVPVTIPPGTFLYCGRSPRYGPPTPPTTAQWLALDEDRALSISGYEGRLFTYMATRELRLLYFDGTSAALIRTGSLDTQDVIIYGNVSEFHWNDPFQGMFDLCQWAKGYNLDGFVRMDTNFEITYCHFTDGLELLSDVDVVPCMGSAPKGWVGSLRNTNLLWYEALAAGNWHREPLASIHVEYSKMISYYNPRYESLVDLRRKVSSRPEHRLLNISASDVQLSLNDLDDALTRAPTARGREFDWRGLMRHIVEQYADRLQYLQHLVHARDGRPDIGDVECHDITRLIFDIRQQILTMLAPYISRASFATLSNGVLNDSWFEQTVDRCSSSHTAHLNTTRFTPQEHQLTSAVEDTLHEICRTLGVIWQTAYTAESVTSAAAVDRLIDWLDWAVWQKCSPACSEDYICSLPQYPYDGIYKGTERATPRCISRLHWSQPHDPDAPPY
ncbi:hypothetical protein CALVIDRAFT_557323 [Calocera viscosa TUFC12733]|uniref:Uncharacterized protein n=1 Tax=Calocera viscosa (strain TUFC12733) TaxID=1330018 RepID=A0A167ISW1_CALVF|nr:hypothetical protein CALVIDRAFT_557323 [Calocera viscosa TUFC12733]